MTNIMATTACNFRCEYCFGLDMIGPGYAAQNMEWKLFQDLINWIERADMPNHGVHLMGGEPTLHPLFPEMCRYAAGRGHILSVFSNASVKLAPDFLRETTSLGVQWIVNINPPEFYTPQQLENLKNHLKLLGPQATLTFNIAGEKTPYDYVFQYIEEYNMAPRIKLGVALPTMDSANVFVNRTDFSNVAELVMEVLEVAFSKGISHEFECGVAYCLFTEKQRKRLNLCDYSNCNSRLDITPWGEVINCLPLCNFARVPYDRFSHYGEAIDWFRKALTPYHSLGSSADCLDCKHLMDGQCRACLAHGMKEYNRLRTPAIPDKIKNAG